MLAKVIEMLWMKRLKELECLKSNLLLQNGEKINIENQYQLNILPPNGANVNMDIPEFNNVTNGVLGNGSHHHILATKMLGKALIVSEGIFLLMNYLLLGDKI